MVSIRDNDFLLVATVTSSCSTGRWLWMFFSACFLQRGQLKRPKESNTFSIFKGLVHSKIYFLFIFYSFSFHMTNWLSWNTEEKILKNVLAVLFTQLQGYWGFQAPKLTQIHNFTIINVVRTTCIQGLLKLYDKYKKLLRNRSSFRVNDLYRKIKKCMPWTCFYPSV